MLKKAISRQAFLNFLSRAENLMTYLFKQWKTYRNALQCIAINVMHCNAVCILPERAGNCTNVRYNCTVARHNCTYLRHLRTDNLKGLARPLIGHWLCIGTSNTWESHSRFDSVLRMRLLYGTVGLHQLRFAESIFNILLTSFIIIIISHFPPITEYG